jgi:uncharacterized protein YecE (DUF72 family)
MTQPMMPTHGIFRAGTSGLVLREPNKQAFPEEHKQKTRLAYYATLFNTIEINSSFYQPPQPVTFTKWSHMVPDDFQFTVKLWREITHARGFVFRPTDIAVFMKAAASLGKKKGCLLIQLPPSVTRGRINHLKQLLEEVQSAGQGWRLAVEFRNKGWYNDDTWRLLKAFKATAVLHDIPSSVIHEPPEDGEFVYIRFHGVKGDYKGSYERCHLQAYAARIQSWLAQGKDVYTYFNNTIGDAVGNLETLLALVS